MNNGKFSLKEIIYYILGVILVSGFVFLYWTRFVNKIQIPPLIKLLTFSWGRNGVFVVNSLVFILFLLFLPYRKKLEWRSKGLFSAFILALFAEMFGIPLLIYILSPIFGYFLTINIPFIGSVYLLKQFFPLGWPGVVVGSYMTLIGMILVFIGWVKIHKSNMLVTDGLYKYIRHPQYTGLILIITGWMLHWSNPLTIIMFPILLILYFVLSKKEEKELIDEFGEEYLEYKKRTKMYIPFVL